MSGVGNASFRKPRSISTNTWIVLARAKRVKLEKIRCVALSEDAMFKMNMKAKTVNVRKYFRTRFGRPEHVCKHWRSPPSR
jgi:hypothetical protein